MQSGAGPLAGVRVVDLSSVIMGPFATRILADMGADVVKVESPEGDSLRAYKPVRNPGMSGVFLHLNRNKRSVVLDLKSPVGREALDALISTADVLVHTMRPKAIARLGYDYERVRLLKDDIVYCGAYGFSTDGPYSEKAAYDDIIQAGSGLADLATRSRGSPAYMPTVLCDKLTGQTIAYSVIAALFARANGAGGQAIEVPMLETSIDFTVLEHLGGFAFEPPLGRPGFSRVLSSHRTPYQTADGHACILPYSDRNWRDFFAFVDRPDLIEDERYRQLGERVQHIDDLYELVAQAAPRHTTKEWIEFCDRVSIPCMPVLAIEELPDDPHLQAVGLFKIAEHPSEGRYKMIRQPVRFSATPFVLRHHAPRLGQHTDEILAEAAAASAPRADAPGGVKR